MYRIFEQIVGWLTCSKEQTISLKLSPIIPSEEQNISIKKFKMGSKKLIESLIKQHFEYYFAQIEDYLVTYYHSQPISQFGNYQDYMEQGGNDALTPFFEWFREECIPQFENLDELISNYEYDVEQLYDILNYDTYLLNLSIKSGNEERILDHLIEYVGNIQGRLMQLQATPVRHHSRLVQRCFDTKVRDEKSLHIWSLEEQFSDIKQPEPANVGSLFLVFNREEIKWPKELIHRIYTTSS
ncbi:MAG: hypothetical protein ACRCTE_06385 [Cellulosilyticaceae bacterium]